MRCLDEGVFSTRYRNQLSHFCSSLIGWRRGLQSRDSHHSKLHSHQVGRRLQQYVRICKKLQQWFKAQERFYCFRHVLSKQQLVSYHNNIFLLFIMGCLPVSKGIINCSGEINVSYHTVQLYISSRMCYSLSLSTRHIFINKKV